MTKSQKIDKKTLKEPDAFVSLSDHVFAWIEKQARWIGLAVLALLLVGLGSVGLNFYQGKAEGAAANALFGPEAELKKAETKVREDRAKKVQELTEMSKGKDKKQKSKPNPELVRPADYAKDYEPAVKKVKEQIQLHSNRKAALVSAMNLSSFLLQQKQYAEALEVARIPTYQPSQKDMLNGFWQMHRGLIFIENEKFDEAIKTYQTVTESPGLKPFHPEAWLKLGIALELKGDAVKARQTYEKIGREFPNTDASSSAQQYLRLLELKSQQG